MNIINNSVDQSFDIKDSAYVQNLAELCHVVMHDLRWSVQGKATRSDHQQTESLRLFSADYGDTLDAVWNFQRLYNQASSDERCYSIDQPLTQHINIGRGMHLYARMFYRKGPWFTIDDLFFRYYCIDSAAVDFGDATVEILVQDCLRTFFLDILQLLQMGLIRTFQSEKECAYVIDDTCRNGYGLLAQGDVAKVRQRLGMSSSSSSKAQRYPSKSKGLGSRVTFQTQGSDQSILKYLSSQQTLSFSSITTTSASKATSLIPVIHHVNELILSKMCEKIYTKISSFGAHTKEPVEKAAMKSPINKIKVQKLFDIWDQLIESQTSQGITNTSSGTSTSFSSCFRLKEEPLITLRRVSRVLLCAGGGPGAMRWDGTNAWISVDENDQVIAPQPKDIKSALPLNAPSNVNWHNVEFPGLRHRLGLQDSHFYNNYKPYLSSVFQRCNDSLQTDFKVTQSLAYIQVFHSYQAFKAWEECVDIRCWVDFLLETKTGCSMLPKKFDFRSKEGCEKFIIGFQLVIDPSSTSNLVLPNLLKESGAAFASLLPVTSKGEFVNSSASTPNNAEDIICRIAIICNYILLFQIERMDNDEMKALIARPWLRHLTWQSVLAYVLWNCVEIFEKNGMYHIAIWILETILYGFTSSTPHGKVEDLSFKSGRDHRSSTKQGYVQFLLSRRVRGKAFDRLQVDYGHLNRKAKSRKGSVNSDHIDYRCLGSCASIPFSFLRKLSRRRKVSIAAALQDIWNIEVLELGLRLEQEQEPPVSFDPALASKLDTASCCKMKSIHCYGWVPITDFSVANSLTKNSEAKVRKRCTYIGRESSTTYDFQSLDVEQLAMEEYFLGNLPSINNHNSHSIPIGGWKGWHNEGSFLRLLFRLLCTEPVLACDLQYANDMLTGDAYEQATIYLSPYQSSPLDLHVAHSFYYTDVSSDNAIPARSFYERRKSCLELFLNDLEHLSSKEVSDLVHECVERYSMRSHKSSPTADSARKLVHTCSAIAAGLGGRALSSIFRSFFFDFRHYSAGLPDLLLIRANYECDSSSIDLSEWLGEVFSDDDKNLTLALDTINKDDYLGCSDKELKLKGIGTSLRSSLAPSTNLKEKLQFLHNGRKVEVKCMVVEVKSNNDSLDERQEDWLNIIDRAIPFQARVCKFTDSE